MEKAQPKKKYFCIIFLETIDELMLILFHGLTKIIRRRFLSEEKVTVVMFNKKR
jgi:hypothetical protein